MKIIYASSILYAQSSCGKKFKQWQIKVFVDEDNKYFIQRIHGFEGCKQTVNDKEISKGKNIGKSNETSVKEQAVKEAESLIKKQKDKNYTEIKTTNTTILPMLAHDFNKRSHDIVFPCYVQPKIDGVRMMFTNGAFTSRTGKSINGLKHISSCVPTDIHLDGELFTFDLPFEEISGISRQLTNNNPAKSDLLKYYVFDCYHQSMTFKERHEMLTKLKFSKNIHIVETVLANTIEEIHALHNKFVYDGYEGIIIRNMDSQYKQNFRSKDLQKLKLFQDEEYIICDGKEGEGNDKDTVIFQCQMQNKKRFWVRPRGTYQYRQQLLHNIKDAIGKQLTVRFQNLTESGVPRFPVGINIRDYE